MLPNLSVDILTIIRANSLILLYKWNETLVTSVMQCLRRGKITAVKKRSLKV